MTCAPYNLILEDRMVKDLWDGMAMDVHGNTDTTGDCTGMGGETSEGVLEKRCREAEAEFTKPTGLARLLFSGTRSTGPR